MPSKPPNFSTRKDAEKEPQRQKVKQTKPAPNQELIFSHDVCVWWNMVGNLGVELLPDKLRTWQIHMGLRSPGYTDLMIIGLYRFTGLLKCCVWNLKRMIGGCLTKCGQTYWSFLQLYWPFHQRKLELLIIFWQILVAKAGSQNLANSSKLF